MLILFGQISLKKKQNDFFLTFKTQTFLKRKKFWPNQPNIWALPRKKHFLPSSEHRTYFSTWERGKIRATFSKLRLVLCAWWLIFWEKRDIKEEMTVSGVVEVFPVLETPPFLVGWPWFTHRIAVHTDSEPSFTPDMCFSSLRDLETNGFLFDFSGQFCRRNLEPQPYSNTDGHAAWRSEVFFSCAEGSVLHFRKEKRFWIELCVAPVSKWPGLKCGGTTLKFSKSVLIEMFCQNWRQFQQRYTRTSDWAWSERQLSPVTGWFMLKKKSCLQTHLSKSQCPETLQFRLCLTSDPSDVFHSAKIMLHCQNMPGEKNVCVVTEQENSCCVIWHRRHLGGICKKNAWNIHKLTRKILVTLSINALHMYVNSVLHQCNSQCLVSYPTENSRKESFLSTHGETIC